ncbi:Nucleic-acid-binding protein from transposon X-element [Danaus plexippus plexippus]|uniref:Nucleic-acid-binding protein from transposon X-element n=1 Tax=Danaus plexippus plexippus TaxID=278856 RepID=A0A212EM92_DANPL|nr:Nucleic-acid-binding protein from transposon X-element [Danaus plexippus plexippus]
MAKGEYEIKILQSKRVKIQAKSPEPYSTIYKKIKSRNTEFYTYNTKQERSFRVVLKCIHHSKDIDLWKEALEDLGHKPTNIWNVKNYKTKQPLPIYFIDLQPDINNKDIYTIKLLPGCRIEVETLRPKRTIPQKPNCVKCAGPHHTSKCSKKERSDEVKCVLCDENHPANYKIKVTKDKISYPLSQKTTASQISLSKTKYQTRNSKPIQK